jgi:hypothetical protein
MTVLPILVAVGLSLPAVAQSLVSPVQSTNAEGWGDNTMPWWGRGPTRYMQLHSDLGSTPRAIRKLAFRQDGLSPGNLTSSLIMDLEMFMGHGVAYDQVRQAFAANYVVPRTAVLARRTVNFGPQGPSNGTGPNPFVGMDLNLDAPYPYNGTDALVWDVALHSAGWSGGFDFRSTDAHLASFTLGTSGVRTGSGCQNMSQTLWAVDTAGTLSLTFASALAPPFQPIFAAIGVSNPNQAVPGLCSNLLTDLQLVLPLGNTDAFGVLREERATFHFPNPAAGATLYTQLHAGDPTSTSPLPVRNSAGVRFTVPTSDLSRIVRVSRQFGSLAATHGEFGTIGNVGFGLVTQFSY